MSDQSFTQLETAILLRDGAFGKRKRNKSNLRILYELHRYIRWATSKGYVHVFPSIRTLCENSGYSESQVHRFFRSPLFSAFGEKLARQNQSNLYRLNENVKALFSFLEKRGIMKSIRDNFDSFHKTFKKFMDKFIIEPLQNGLSIQMVINKLSTISKRIRHPLTREYGTLAITTFGVTKRSKDDKKNFVIPEDDSLREVLDVHSDLKNRLHIFDADIKQFLGKNELRKLKTAVKTLTYRVQNLKWRPRSMVRALQSLLNQQKRAA